MDVVTLASLVEFSYMFGSLVDALEKLDGVLMSLTACSMAQAETLVTGAPPGSFVLYVASRPTQESLAVLGLAYAGVRGRVAHRHLFRDPVSRRFYTDADEPAFQRLDLLVATVIGAEETFARQTRLKLDELERIKEMVCAEQKRQVRVRILSVCSLFLTGPGSAGARQGVGRGAAQGLCGLRSCLARLAAADPVSAAGGAEHRGGRASTRARV